MAEFKETVTSKQASGLDSSGAAVHQRTRQVNTTVEGDTRTTATNIVWFVVGIVEVLLGLRFALKLLGANPSSGFADFIYSFTNILTAPFDSLFGVATAQSGSVQSVFEPSILVAAVVYALIGWGIVKLMNIDRSEPV